MFTPLQELIQQTYQQFEQRNIKQLPTSKILNKYLGQQNLNQKSLRFVTQDDDLPYPELGYEQRIYQHGIIATRSNNWHDYFNALIWLKHPQTKSAINAIHQQEIKKQTTNLRSKRRDLLTLFDECGVLVFAEEKIVELIKQHKWQELFVENKESWQDGSITIETFGHAMYEKYLNPYIGMTAKALFLPSNIDNVDNYLAKELIKEQLLVDKKELFPLPMLGIPNWHKHQTQEFYDNRNYFR